MTSSIRDAIPTRSKLLELRQEKHFVNEGFEFLDQKRMLLAAETLRWLGRYDTLEQEVVELMPRAAVVLAEAVAFVGTGDLERIPGGVDTLVVDGSRREIFGIPLVEAAATWVADPDAPPVDRCPEWRRCRSTFTELTSLLVELAAVVASLHALTTEYQRTERRARALEEVILPELGAAIEQVADHLDAEELEEAVRLRLRGLRPRR